MTKKELRDYCYSVGLVDTKFIFKDMYASGYRFNAEFVSSYDFIVAWDKSKDCVVVANGSSIDEDYKSECKIRMNGATCVENDEEIKTRIDDLIKSVQENIKFLKLKQIKKKIKMIEGDFE